MSQLPAVDSAARRRSGAELVAPELTLSETLRVLEVARGMRQERDVAEVALARNETREVMRKRLLDAAVITGDRISEADVDAAIDQYFSTQHVYADPPFSFSVFLAHVYIRRTTLAIIGGLILLCAAVWKFLLASP